MRFKAVLIDIDNTLFDFHKSSFQALVQSFSQLGVTFTPEMFRDYTKVNDWHWEAYERGEIQKDEIYAHRFEQYFASIGLKADETAFDRSYRKNLAEQVEFMPHCRELLQALHGKYRVVVVTNGDTYAQERRIQNSGMAAYFDDVFISEQLGCKKPDASFFDKVFAAIGEEYRACSIMVGDSLSSDMQGGRNAGIPTCFFGSKERADDRCDFVIADLLELIPILEA